jgi:chemotaxis protein CheD
MSETNGKIIKVLIGQVALTRPPNRLESVLGSCIGLVLYDAEVGIAGMAHILLPDSAGRQTGNLPGKYADHAVPCLIDGLVRHGASRGRLKAKYAGGARMFSKSLDYQNHDVGGNNSEAVRMALREADIAVVSRDVGGAAGRKVIFHLDTMRLHIEDFSSRSEVI